VDLYIYIFMLLGDWGYLRYGAYIQYNTALLLLVRGAIPLLANICLGINTKAIQGRARCYCTVCRRAFQIHAALPNTNGSSK
jgi:hypothetical protein